MQELRLQMELETDGKMYVYIGFGDDLPLLWRQAISNTKVKKESESDEPLDSFASFAEYVLCCTSYSTVQLISYTVLCAYVSKPVFHSSQQ